MFSKAIIFDLDKSFSHRLHNYLFRKISHQTHHGILFGVEGILFEISHF